MIALRNMRDICTRVPLFGCWDAMLKFIADLFSVGSRDKGLE